MNDCKLYDHLTGDAVKPSPVDAAKPTEAEKASIKEWKKNENKAMSLLVSWLHDSTFHQVHAQDHHCKNMGWSHHGILNALHAQAFKHVH